VWSRKFGQISNPGFHVLDSCDIIPVFEFFSRQGAAVQCDKKDKRDRHPPQRNPREPVFSPEPDLLRRLESTLLPSIMHTGTLILYFCPFCHTVLKNRYIIRRRKNGFTSFIAKSCYIKDKRTKRTKIRRCRDRQIGQKLPASAKSSCVICFQPEGLSLSVQNETHIFRPMLLDENHQFIVVPIIGRCCTMFVSNMFVNPVSRIARIWSRTVSVMVDPPATILSVCDRKATAVVPAYHDGADIIDSDHGAKRPNGRCLNIIHLDELHSASAGELLPHRLDNVLTRKSHLPGLPLRRS